MTLLEDDARTVAPSRARRLFLRSLGTAGAGTAIATASALTHADPAGAASTLPLTGSLASASTQAIGSRVTGDSVDRWSVAADGSIEWGSGTGSSDVRLYRPSAKVLGLGTAGDGMSLRLFGRPAGQANPGSYPTEVLSVATDSSVQRAVFASHNYGNGESTDAYRPWLFFGQYRATDASPGQARLLGLSTTLNYGVNGASPVAPLGTGHAFTSEVVVFNSGSQSNEVAANVSAVRFDMGTGFPASSSTPGRGWLADMGIHGPVGLQADLLTGLTTFINNYHSAQPASAESGGVFVVTKPGAGTAASSVHQSATTHPVGVGIGVLGASGASNSGLGFNVGIRVGGTGSGWDVTTSRIGTGIEVRDYRDAGIRLSSRTVGGSGPAIQTDDNAGDVIIGGSISPLARLHVTGTVVDNVGTTLFNAVHRVSAAGRALSYFGGAFQPTATIGGGLLGNVSITSLLANGGSSFGVGQVVGSFNRVDTDSAYSGAIGEMRIVEVSNPSHNGSGAIGTLTGLYIADLATASTTKYAIYVAGAQTSRFGGALSLANGADMLLGTSSGNKLGTATNQKLGFWGATPVVRPSGWAAPTGTATRTTFSTATVSTAALAQRVKALIDDLTAVGLIGS